MSKRRPSWISKFFHKRQKTAKNQRTQKQLNSAKRSKNVEIDALKLIIQNKNYKFAKTRLSMATSSFGHNKLFPEKFEIKSQSLAPLGCIYKTFI